MIQKMQNCYITLLKNLWSVDGIWTGKGATLFNDCEWSQDSNDDQEVELDFTKWEFWDKKTDQMLLGTSDPESATYCKNLFPGSGSSTTTTTTTGSYSDGIPRVQVDNVNAFQAVAQNLFDYASSIMETSTTGSEYMVMGTDNFATEATI